VTIDIATQKFNYDTSIKKKSNSHKNNFLNIS